MEHYVPGSTVASWIWLRFVAETYRSIRL